MAPVTHDVVLECLPLKAGQRYQKWRVYYDGAVLLKSVRDPEFAACRKLQSMGLTGRLRTKRRESSHYGMTMGIEWGARHRTIETDRIGPVIGLYEKLDARKVFGRTGEVKEVNG